uniref:Uncharacterized protein n=2 Tax=Avena sativa TaxID=4498 RepID=A0ACD5X5M6_AVESA
MEEETAFPGLSDFEFFLAIYQDSWDRLRLPDKFAELLDGREPREVKLREAGGGRRLWDVEVVFDGDGHMYLGRGWDRFAREYRLQQGHFLVFSYHDGGEVLTVKVFDGSMCRYQHDHDDASTTPAAPLSSRLVTVKEEEVSTSPGSESSGDSGSKNGIDDSGSKNGVDSGGKNGSTSSAEIDMGDARTSQFTVMLKQCHLGVRQKQYLNVPADFQVAHQYSKRTKVVLRMRGGRSWPVTLKHRTSGYPRASLRYGWHQFCIDNRLGVGDTCFFRALRGSDADLGEDHQLKVEVRRRDGTFAN